MEIVVLTLIAGFASIISGITGLGGGVILLAAMGQFLPPIALVPVHGLIQLVSNSSRVALGFRQLNWQIILQFLYGAILGSTIGGLVVLNLPKQVLSLTIGFYLVVAVWLPISNKLTDKLHLIYPLIGFISSFLSLFIGVSGPLIHPILAKDKAIKKESFIGTEAACSGMMHFFKFFVFLQAGFAFKSYLPLIVAMTVATLVGILIGSKVLKKMKEESFHLIIKIVVTILAVRMIVLSF